MKTIFLRFIKIIPFSLIAFSFASCALSAISSDYNFEDSNLKEISLEKLGDGKILIYNNVDFMHKFDNTGRLNFWIDNRPAGQIRSGEYIIVRLSQGKHQFRLLHIDIVNIRSSHDIEVDQSTKIIKIKATSSSNDLQVINALPAQFSTFKYAPKRK